MVPLLVSLLCYNHSDLTRRDMYDPLPQINTSYGLYMTCVQIENSVETQNYSAATGVIIRNRDHGFLSRRCGSVAMGTIFSWW